jgi:hypothetical protein
MPTIISTDDGDTIGDSLANANCDCITYSATIIPDSVTYQDIYTASDFTFSDDITPGDTFVINGITYTYGVARDTQSLKAYKARGKKQKIHLLTDTTHLPNPAYSYWFYFLQMNEGLPTDLGAAKTYRYSDGSTVVKYYIYTKNNTVGYGHKLEPEELARGTVLVSKNPDVYVSFRDTGPNSGLTKAQVDSLLNLDVQASIVETQKFLGNDRWEYMIKYNHTDWLCILCDILFNGGLGDLQGYHQLIYYMGLTSTIIRENLSTLNSPSIPFKIPKQNTGAELAKQIANIAKNATSLGETRRNTWTLSVFVHNSGPEYDYVKAIVGENIKS